ncbi:hypothetical protein D3Z36_10075 [Lachnospiraceae bacterium]|nr:hypothetical protein [Lachnospiraceae bacterium]
MKAIAMYLPQFHHVPENDAWWGSGFTDWKAMSMAKPLFDGHNQPKEPLNHYQYDLLNKETFLWQEKLMKDYHIYGFCFYHYWFKEGKKILEKPAENLLRWTDIEIPFCFSWANISWVRSWSNLGDQTVWASSFETDEPHTGNGILLEQEYGNKEDWTEHFYYLLPFFKDKRYIKKENKPLIIIHRQEDLHCLKEMRKVWNELALLNGFPGIYIIGNFYDGVEHTCADAMLVMEPGKTIGRDFPARFANQNRMEVARYLSYEEVWKNSLEWQASLHTKTYYGGFCNYDDTPRRGNAGTIIYNDTPEKFKVYLTDLYAKNKACGNEFVFINAWNEWGEGMHLEPDEEHGYGFLEAIPYAENHYLKEVYKYTPTEKNQETDIKERQISRYKQEVSVLSNWLFTLEHQLEIAQWLLQHNYKRVGIYGFGVLGKHLLAQLLQKMEFLCCIDRDARSLKLDVPVFLPDEIPQLDLLVITNVHIYNEIHDALNHENIAMISLETLIKNIVNET